MIDLRRAFPRATAFGLLLASVVTSSLHVGSGLAQVIPPPRPDVIVIVTDDQRADTLRYLPRIRSWLPTRFTSAFVSNPSCCPSRTSMLHGTYSRTNGLWTNGAGPDGSLRASFGGWHRYTELGLDEVGVPSLLHDAGYRTGHIGKFLNGFSPATLEDLPAGWDTFWAHAVGIEPGAGPDVPYLDYVMAGIEDGGFASRRYGSAPQDHSTRTLTREALAFLRQGGAQPLFLHLSFPAPHARIGSVRPLPLRQDLRATVQLPALPPSVNEQNVRDKPSFVAGLPGVPVTRIERWRRAAARSLLGVDRAVDRLLEAQAERDPGLANTLVLFVSDNGFLHGEHRWFGKGVPYDPAIRVPLLASWRELPAGRITSIVSNVDVAETVASVAGVDLDTDDARSLLAPDRGFTILEGMGARRAYCGIRTDDAKFVKYATGEVEYYDLRRDPHELRNRPLAPAAARLYETAAEVCAGQLPPGWPAEVAY